jgi:ActR/RegA family two-component response regulator
MAPYAVKGAPRLGAKTEALVMAEDTAVRQNLAAGLEMRGYDVTLAHDRGDAELRLKTRFFPLFIVDAPGQMHAGFRDLVESARKLNPRQTVVMIHEARLGKEMMGHIGCHHYIHREKELDLRAAIVAAYEMERMMKETV